MTTERQEPLNESVVDPTTVSIDSPTEDVTTFDEPQNEFEEVTEVGVGVDDGDIQVGESPTEAQSDGSDIVNSPAFRRYQSATDKKMAELEKQLSTERQARDEVQAKESLKNLDVEVAQYAQQKRDQLLQQGMDDVTAQQMANEQAGLAKEAYLSNLQVQHQQRQNQQQASEINSRTQLARAYELASQYGIPFSELQEVSNPAEMERHAKSLKRIKDLEGRLQGVTPSQQYGSATPASDVAPSDASAVLDRYNAGDPAVTTDMARSASQKLGLTIFD
jgi:hypothetical protein